MSVEKILNDLLIAFEGNSTPDVLLLRQVISKTEDVMGLTLGVLVWSLIVGIFVITAVDLAFLNFPSIRRSLGDSYKIGKIRFISLDAISALNNGYINSDTSPSQLYLNKRIKTYILTILIVVIMVSGTWDIILNFLTNLVNIVIVWFWSI